MSRSKRIKRPKAELQAELREQLNLLRHSCTAFDEGFEAIGKHIALSLRVLLHQHGRSRALLDQLGLRSGRFLDSAGPLNPKNLLTECKLVVMRLSDSSGRYLPAIHAGGGPLPLRPVPFVEWWNNPVIKDKTGHTFCRRELVLNVANTDGGAHVDPNLDERYMALSRQNSLGWVFENGNVAEAFSGRPELACVRQIAHEVLETIVIAMPDYQDAAQQVV